MIECEVVETPLLRAFEGLGVAHTPLTLQRRQGSVKGNAGVLSEERRAVVFRPYIFRSLSPVSLVLSWRWWKRIHVVFLGDEVG